MTAVGPIALFYLVRAEESGESGESGEADEPVEPVESDTKVGTGEQVANVSSIYVILVVEVLGLEENEIYE